MARGCSEAMSWKSKFVRQLAEVNCWMVRLLKCDWCLLLHSRLRMCRSELIRELTDVNCWLLCLLKCWLVLPCVTIANLLISEIISWESESVRGVV